MANADEFFDGEDRVILVVHWPHHDFDHPDELLQMPLE
jgi:hypothetical protein